MRSFIVVLLARSSVAADARSTSTADC